MLPFLPSKITDLGPKSSGVSRSPHSSGRPWLDAGNERSLSRQSPGSEQGVYEPDASEGNVDTDLTLARFRLLAVLYNQILRTTDVVDDHSSHAAILPIPRTFRSRICLRAFPGSGGVLFAEFVE